MKTCGQGVEGRAEGEGAWKEGSKAVVCPPGSPAAAAAASATHHARDELPEDHDDEGEELKGAHGVLELHGLLEGHVALVLGAEEPHDHAAHAALGAVGGHQVGDVLAGAVVGQAHEGQGEGEGAQEDGREDAHDLPGGVPGGHEAIAHVRPDGGPHAEAHHRVARGEGLELGEVRLRRGEGRAGAGESGSGGCGELGCACGGWRVCRRQPQQQGPQCVHKRTTHPEAGAAEPQKQHPLAARCMLALRRT